MLYRGNGKENGNYYLGFRVLGLRVGGLGLRLSAAFRVQVSGFRIVAGF